MKISILVVSYNQEAYIHEAIQSILMQKLDCDFEVIVADDCSTDNTLSIIIELLSNAGVEFTVLDGGANLGLERNYERGFAACSGEYIAVMEGDDYWVNSRRLEKHIVFLDEHQECSMSFNRKIKYFQGINRFSVDPWLVNEDFCYITIEQLAYANHIGNMSTCVFRNEHIKSLDKEIYGLPFADWLLGMCMAQFGLAAKLKDATSVYRVHSAGKWSVMSEENKIDEIIRVIDEYDRYFDYKYNTEFKNHKKKLDYRNTLMDYLPPFVKPLLKYLVPPVLVTLIRRKK